MSEADAEAVRADSLFLGGLGSPGSSASTPCQPAKSSVGHADSRVASLGW